jgi:hypothetical protein
MDQTKPPIKPTNNWYQEFGLRYRRPRVKLKHVKKLLASAWPPEIEFHEDFTRKTTELIVRFPSCSLDLPAEVREIYFRRGMTPAKAFQYVLRNTLRPTDQRTARAQLASLGYNSLRAVWLHMLEQLYLEKSDPRANKKLHKNILALDAATSLHQGKRPASAVDDENVRAKYEELLSHARLVHETVMTIVIKSRDTKMTPSAANIRPKLWASLETQLKGTRTAYLIFTGDVFRTLSREEQGGAPVRLHVPNDWQPEELAVALLAREERKSYKTMKKTIKRIVRNSATTSH